MDDLILKWIFLIFFKLKGLNMKSLFEWLFIVFITSLVMTAIAGIIWLAWTISVIVRSFLLDHFTVVLVIFYTIAVILGTIYYLQDK